MHYDLCDVTPFSGQNGLSQNKSKVHEGIRYECNSYDYKAPRKQYLKQHTMKYHNVWLKNLSRMINHHWSIGEYI